MLWKDQMQPVYVRKPISIPELKLFCEEKILQDNAQGR